MVSPRDLAIVPILPGTIGFFGDFRDSIGTEGSWRLPEMRGFTAENTE
jgi:hypothetical protein